MPIRRNFDLDLDPQAPSRERIEWDFDIEPVLLAGGAIPREHDAGGPVRPTGVLGQVRWFWRLLHHHLEVAQLREEENRAFGGRIHRDKEEVVSASPFSIQINSHRGIKVDTFPAMNDPLGYLLFSGRGEVRKGTPPADLAEKVWGTIRVIPGRNPLDENVKRAFRLWSLLGGVGARTRRGIGAVQIRNCQFTVDSLSETIRTLLGSPTPVESTSGHLRRVRSLWIGEQPFRSSKECLVALESWYRNYRQDRRPGSPPRPGRSYWDEPEGIRNLTGRRARKHPKLPPTSAHASGWARAALGLPIVFQFKDAKDNDPDPTQLEGREYDRMASPLLFRPVRLTTSSYVPVVVLLSGPYEPPGGLRLKAKGQSFDVPLTSEPDRVFTDLIASASAKALALRQVI